VTSKDLIDGATAKYKELANKGWDWRSFYNGYLEGATANIKPTTLETKVEVLEGAYRTARDKMARATDLLWSIHNRVYLYWDDRDELLEALAEVIDVLR
jgi:hypothetical protein